MPNAVPRNARFYDVPAGTKPTRCNGADCGRPMYWARNPTTGRAVPVDCDVEGGRTPSVNTNADQMGMFGVDAEVHDGRGVSHFLTCVNAAQFSGQGARRA